MTPIILYDGDDGRVVQIFGEYHPEWNQSIEEMKVVFLPQAVELHRFTNGDEGKLEMLTLTSEEMDTLTSAWDAFKAEQEFKKLAEQKRVASIVEQARELLVNHPIILEEYPESETNNHRWCISSKELESIRYTAYNSEQLLPYTQDAVSVWLRYLEAQGWIEEAHKIAKECPAIQIYDNLVDMKHQIFTHGHRIQQSYWKT